MVHGRLTRWPAVIRDRNGGGPFPGTVAVDQSATGSDFLGVHDFPEWIPFAGEVVAASVAVGVHCGQGEPRVVLGVTSAVTALGFTSPIVSQITVRRNRGAGGECQGFLKLQHHGLGLLTSRDQSRTGPNGRPTPAASFAVPASETFAQKPARENPSQRKPTGLNEVMTKAQHFI